MDKEKLTALFSNLDALDVPESLRARMAEDAWYHSYAFMAAEYTYINGVQSDHNLTIEEALHWNVLQSDSGSVGRQFVVAEAYLAYYIQRWRQDKDSHPAYRSDPWEHYDVTASPAYQRRLGQVGTHAAFADEEVKRVAEIIAWWTFSRDDNGRPILPNIPPKGAKGLAKHKRVKRRRKGMWQ